MKHKRELVQVIGVDKDNCVNCHICINACPVKYCNDGSGDYVKVNQNLCIACGSCLTACTHNARYYIDDFTAFLNDLKKGEKIVAIVAPSAAASFPGQYLNLNGWLKSLGIEAIFDVSFGAELTVISYLDHVKSNNPKAVIAQPCAAIVTYIEIFKPELIEYLAPVDSPMLHTIKLIKNYYPAFKDHKVAILSPCIAKKREFEETGLGEYNVSYLSVSKYLKEFKISLDRFPKAEFDNPPAERAVLFSTPGGLMQTAERWMPEIRFKTRKIEGVHTIYEYLEELPKIIAENKAPLLIDCLNCERGCNAGPLTLTKEKQLDEIEYWINRRNDEMQRLYKDNATELKATNKEAIEKVLNNYWKPDIYNRKYGNISHNYQFITPNFQQLWNIYRSMHKYSESDLFNCASCGYGRCERMAFAIFNKLNRPENCHFYLSKESTIAHEETTRSQKRLKNILETMLDGFLIVNNDTIFLDVNPSLKRILKTDDIVGKSLFDFLDDSNSDVLKQQLKLRSENKHSSYEIILTCVDGSKVYCLFNGSPLFEDDKKIGSFAIVTDITERKKAEQEVLENELRFRTLFESAGSAILIMKGDTFIHCNKKTLEIFGCAYNDIIGASPDKFSPEKQPDGSKSIEKAMERISDAINGNSQFFYWVHSKLNGKTFDAEVSLNTIEIKGEILIQAIVSDISDRKNAERELQKSRDELEIRVIERTQELTETVEELKVSQEVIASYNKELENLSLVASKTDNGVLIMDNRGTIEWVNEGYARMLGYPDMDSLSIVGKNFTDLCSGDVSCESLKRCFETRQSVVFESQGTTWNDSKIWMQTTLNAVSDPDGSITKLVAINSDISELKKAEEEIRLQNEEISTQRDAIEQRANELSDALENLKKSQEKLVESEKMVALGQLISGIAHEINTPLGAILSSVGNISNTLQHVLVKLPDFFRMLTEDQKNDFFSLLEKSLLKEITITSKEERVYKRKLKQTLEESNIQKPDEFADTLVDMGIYDKIEPFISLLSSEKSQDILQMAYKLSGLLRSSQTISTAAERARKVVFALKSFAHYSATGEMVKANIHDTIETVLTLYYNQLKHGVNVNKKYGEIPQILCYPDELNQVWTNLIHNALQAMDNKGTLTITTSITDQKVIISFTDSGPGIPDAIKEKIFKPFFTTKAQGEGSGLGLDIVRRIIEKHNGEITFDSVPGKTTFYVKLNLND